MYILGIECDGASYHSGRSARDRDRLRQEILVNLGWKIHRVWSTDWFRGRETEIQRLLQSVKQVIDQDPDVRKEREQMKRVKSLRDRLIDFRENILKREFPNSDPKKGLLRDALLSEFVKHRPPNREEWFRIIPAQLRTATEGKQIAQFLNSVLAIIGECS
jgi:hypothetical protein